ncbi:hypothetical protein A4G20_07645 [Pasteurellaceae bacterium RH1A]|nr:hypothetical protein A4G20_07645 [Pasteurellaceae bacterium RH1A]
MQTIEQLTQADQSAWAVLKTWFKQTRNHFEILSADKKVAGKDLFSLQISVRSPMGAVIYETGGILINHGWLRILGSGSPKLNRGLLEWNFGKTFQESGEQPSYLLVADDVLGGYFGLNAGGLGPNVGKIYYYSPQKEEWQDLNLSYSEFLGWALNADLMAFYQGFYWQNWQADVQNLDGNQVYRFEPELSHAAKMDDRSKQAVAIERHFEATFNVKDKYGVAYSVS